MVKKFRVLQQFDPSKPIYVRRPLRAGGRPFGKDDVFPWRQMAVDVRRVRQMFEQGKLYHAREDAAGGAETIGAEPQEAVAQEPVTPTVQDSGKMTVDELIENYQISDLRDMARKMGVPTKRSKKEQAELIVAAY